ncbi:hypothetical protein PLICRDRAFT_124285 [Plicaturopsis crispa FD-325 SS-3]|nr:hypothetical protein PLICRDRAFT_124285 [Plicaturopsis crispa FD-325 SS-3]
MAPSSSSSAATTSVQVALRIRPTTSADTTSIPARFQRTVVHATSSTSVTVDAGSAAPSAAGPATAGSAGPGGKKQVFAFDQVHPQSTTQHELYTSTAQPLINRFVEGFNCTILAYGQTSSGKTFTMTGIDLDANPSDPNNGMGIIPRAVSNIFTRARQLKEERGATWNYNIKGSFIEIYNEDLIDLLSSEDVGAGRREVQIREDKDGHIIWGGLREVTVKNSSEVMKLILQGTSIRRTNETDMNAQSSRSHAIFSLTLTQKKYTGSGPPPRSSSPLPPGGRSPSRLARPGSMYTSPTPGGSTRVSSPTQGRPGTPSFASAMGRGGGLRPSSALGVHGGDGRGGGDDDSGEWVTVVSKFHFVDLAGSERLKRTAAAGERVKEGISINSGLLALGNVISALGDPSRAKSHMATHIPYRDSKLTRLLQDSLGGNAHTLMIACVSPTEWNTGETVNTLKYANRARNIKNRAVISEKEDGWDDVEWLQGTVSRLRKELKVIKETGGGGSSAPIVPDHPAPQQGAGKKVLAQMTDLQNNYEDLREKYVERTEELTRLRRELGEKQRGSTGGAIGGTAKYEEIVGPVIEEYEKTISTMEAELDLNRAALRHTNEMYEEREEELAAATERHAATELYVEELRSRVSKLTEREASTEAYVRDLEEKIKHYDDSSMSSSESLSDLKREVTRYKDVESHSSKYIADLEARLARSDESVIALRQTVEKLEGEGERRREEVELLQARLEALTKDSTGWRDDLEKREKTVRELEAKMAEWEQKKQQAGEERVRLGAMVGQVAQARKNLEDLNPAGVSESVTPNESPSGAATPNSPTLSLENQLVTLQQTHTATLADLSSVTSKYRDALREISDLAAQIQELKLSNAAALVESPIIEKTAEIPPFRRRMTGSRSRESSGDAQYNAQGRRLFFRQAASSESLHSRSLSQSQSLSQELSSARSRNASTSSHTSNSSMSHSPSHKPDLSITLPGITVSPSERSVTSLETEIMRLQEVLKEREAEITALEGAVKAKDSELDSAHANGHAVNGGTLSPKTKNRFEVIRRSMEIHAVPEHGEAHSNGSNSPDTDESLARLNELMLSMAQKESAHREIVDSLNDQLAQIRRQHDDLTTLSRDQALNMSTELETLRGRHADDLDKLDKVQQNERELLEILQKTESDHAKAIEELRREHEEALHAKGAEVDGLLARMKEEHAFTVDNLRGQLSAASAALEQAHQEHNEAFGKLQAEHEETLRARLQEVNDVLAQTRQEHDALVDKAASEHESALRQKEAEAAATLERTEEEYFNALTKLRSDHAEAIEKQAAEAEATLARLREEHAGELRMAEIAKEGSISESQSARSLALQQLQDEHAAAIARKEASLTQELENMKNEHAQALSNKENDYSAKLERLRAKHASSLASKAEEHELELERVQAEHAAAVSKLKEESSSEITRLTSSLKKAEEDYAVSSQKAQDEHAAALRALQEQQAGVLQEVTRAHEEELAKLAESHEKALKDISAVDEDRTNLIRAHTEETAKLEAEHQQAIAEVNAALIAAQEQHVSDLESARVQGEQLLSEERDRLAASLSEMEHQHSEERATLRKDHDLLVQELESQKAAFDIAIRERDDLKAELADAHRQHSEELESLRKDHSDILEELESHKAAAAEFSVFREETHESHAKALDEKTQVIDSMQQELASAHGQRDELAAEVAELRAELDRTLSEQSKLIQEASKRESLVGELEKHRSVLADVQENLQRAKDEKDNIQAEKLRQEVALRELQAQVARLSHSEPQRPAPDRNVSFNRSAAIPAMKPPPPTPPPSVPPPPVPRGAPTIPNGDAHSTTTNGSTLMSSASSRDSALDSPSTSVVPSVHDHNSSTAAVDPKLTARLEEQAKHLSEQEAMIKTLNKQLSHCESDLQAHMDLVTTLETSLGDSEKNLRKARMHATELARERDGLNVQIDSLRNELSQAKLEVVSVRRSIVEEKQSLEHRLDEERRAKERARQQLDTRMDELQKRKSKFACL